MKKICMSCVFSMILYSGICQNQISVYWNQKKEVEYFLNKVGLIEKKIIFPSPKEVDTVHFFYKLGVVDSISYRGVGELVFFDEDLDKKEIADAKAFMEYLDEFKIRIPYPYLNIGILKEVSSIFESADKQYKLNINPDRSQFVFKKLNKRYDFKTEISRFIPNDKIVFSYVLNQREGVVLGDKFVFEDGILTRNFFYEGDKLLKITYVCKYYNDREIWSDVKEFRKY